MSIKYKKSRPSAPTAIDINDYILVIQYLNDSGWSSDLILDINQANWETWSRAVFLMASHWGFENWINGTLPQPDNACQS